MPENWEKANVTPGFKKDKENTGNKQLVSLTSNPGKVMEWLILEAISGQGGPRRLSGLVSRNSPKENHD